MEVAARGRETMDIAFIDGELTSVFMVVGDRRWGRHRWKKQKRGYGSGKKEELEKFHLL